MTAVVLREIQEKHGEKDGKPWTRYTMIDGNGQTIGATFSAELANAARTLIGAQVDADVKAAANPKFAPDLLAIRPAAPEAAQAGADMTKDEWAARDSAAHKRACIAIAVSALGPVQGRGGNQPDSEDLNRYLERVAHLSGAWHRVVLAVRDDPAGEDVPF